MRFATTPGVTTDTSLSAPEAPTPFDPKGWGERCDINTIRRTRVPSIGPNTWRPLPHGTFIDMIEQAFSRHGFTVSEPLHYRAKSTQNAKIKDLGEYGRFISTWGLAHPEMPEVSGLGWEASFVNSYDMTKSAQGALGRRIQICSNGLIMGTVESSFRRKHTSGIDANREGLFEHIYDLVNNTVGNLTSTAQAETKRMEQYRQTECSDSDARWVIMEAAKKNVIGAAATMKVLEHFERPEHPEFRDGSVMCLDNAFTSNDRGKNIMTQSDRFRKLSDIIDTRFGFNSNVDSEELATNF